MTITTTFVGNLVDDPELRFTPSGQAVAGIRVAVSERKQENGKWVDGDTSFITVQVCGARAENVAESLVKADRVIVVGRAKQRSYETKDGDKRTVFEVTADAIGPDLTFATAKIIKSSRGKAGEQNRDDDPWQGRVVEAPRVFCRSHTGCGSRLRVA